MLLKIVQIFSIRVKVIALFYAFQTDFAQDVGLSFIRIIQFENRIVIGFGHEFKFHIAPFSDCSGIGYGIRKFPEDVLHLLRAFKIEFRCAEAESFRIVQRSLGLNAQHNFMSFGMLFFQIMYVIGCRELQVELFSEFNQFAINRFFLLHTVIHQFEEEVLRADNFNKFFNGLFRPMYIAAQDVGGNFAANAGGEDYQTL